MAVEVVRSLAEVQGELDKLNQKLKETQPELRALNSALKIDPSNFELSAQKVAILSEQLEINRQRAEDLAEQTELLKQKVEDGTYTDEQAAAKKAELARLTNLTDIEIVKLTASIDQQNAAMKAVPGAADDAAKSIDKTQLSVRSLQSAFRSAASAVNQLYGFMTGWKDMTWFERVMKSISIGLMVAATAAAIFKTTLNPAAWAGILVAATAAALGLGALGNALGLGESSSSVGTKLSAGGGGTAGKTIVPQTTTTETRTVNINLSVAATGETPISRENSRMISSDLADQLNLTLGGITG